MEMKTGYDYEVGVIGSLLIDPDPILGDMMAAVSPEDFSTPAFRHIYEAARGLWLEQRPVDAMTIQGAAGEEYRQTLIDCMNLTPTAAHWRAYADGMKAATRARKLDELADKLMDALDLPGKLAVLAQMQELQTDRSSVREVTWLDGLRAAYMRHSERKRPDYLSWGIPALDHDLYALPGSFLILGGFSSSGKTALGTQFAEHFALTGKRVGFYSLETDDQTLFDRMIAQTSGAHFGRMKNATLTMDDYNAIIRTGQRTKNWVLTYVGAAGWNCEQIRAHALARRFDVIVIDYVQLISSSGSNRAEEVARVSMALHTFAQSTGTTVLALSQLTPSDKATPGMNDLRESRQLTQDADVIMMLNRDEDEGATKYDRILHIVKNKEGETFRTRLTLDPATMRIEPDERRQADEEEETNSRGFAKPTPPPAKEVAV